MLASLSSFIVQLPFLLFVYELGAAARKLSATEAKQIEINSVEDFDSFDDGDKSDGDNRVEIPRADVEPTPRRWRLMLVKIKAIVTHVLQNPPLWAILVGLLYGGLIASATAPLPLIFDSTLDSLGATVTPVE